MRPSQLDEHRPAAGGATRAGLFLVGVGAGVLAALVLLLGPEGAATTVRAGGLVGPLLLGMVATRGGTGTAASLPPGPRRPAPQLRVLAALLALLVAWHLWTVL